MDNMDRDDQISLAAFDPLAQPAVRLLVETIDTAFVEKVREKMVMADRPTTYQRNGKRTLVLLYAGRSGSTYAAELLSNHPSVRRELHPGTTLWLRDPIHGPDRHPRSIGVWNRVPGTGRE